MVSLSLSPFPRAECGGGIPSRGSIDCHRYALSFVEEVDPSSLALGSLECKKNGNLEEGKDMRER
ncbi:hypothetical protein LguiA_035869 [Lonicera macranthoides]